MISKCINRSLLERVLSIPITSKGAALLLGTRPRTISRLRRKLRDVPGVRSRGKLRKSRPGKRKEARALEAFGLAAAGIPLDRAVKLVDADPDMVLDLVCSGKVRTSRCGLCGSRFVSIAGSRCPFCNKRPGGES